MPVQPISREAIELIQARAQGLDITPMLRDVKHPKHLVADMAHVAARRLALIVSTLAERRRLMGQNGPSLSASELASKALMTAGYEGQEEAFSDMLNEALYLIRLPVGE